MSLSGPELDAALRRHTNPAPDALRRALAELRPVPGDTPADRLRRMQPALATLADGTSPARALLLTRLPAFTGFHARMIEVGLELQLARLHPDALAELVFRHPRATRARARTAIVEAGNIPGLAALDVAIAVACGDPVAVKCPSAEPLTGVVAAELLSEATGVRGAVGGSWGREETHLTNALLDWSERLVAVGSDATVDALLELWNAAGGGERLAFGHRVSAAWVPEEAFPLDELARRLAVDVALWDQEGCLSPHVIFVHDSHDALALGESLSAVLDALAESLPRGERSLEERAATRAWLSRFEARHAATGSGMLRVWNGRADGHVVVLDTHAPAGPSPLGRAVRILPVAGVEEMLRALAGWPLQSLGVGAPLDAHAELAEPLARLGASRLAVAGRMQEPGPAWVGDEDERDGRRHVAIESDTVGVWSALTSSAVES